MNFTIELIITGTIAFFLTLVHVPTLNNLAMKAGLVDKPNHRKSHKNLIPLTGGLAIAIATVMALFLSSTFISGLRENMFMLGTSIIMLIIGVLDDRVDIKPIYRLVIQFGCAYAVAASGVRITSLYGVFGIEEIPVIAQYILTITVIVGVVNGFNLMDGVDGLAGSLALIGFIAFAIISYSFRKYDLTIIFMALISAILGFLRFNLSKNKIFMGDGGSLFLGFLLVVSGINLIEISGSYEPIPQYQVLMIVISVFLVPVLDSVRVYAGRMKQGISPFTADKSHLHHLFLLMGLSHKFTALAVTIACILLLLITVTLAFYFPMTIVLIFAWLAFKMLTQFLNTNKNMSEWKIKIQQMESE